MTWSSEPTATLEAELSRMQRFATEFGGVFMGHGAFSSLGLGEQFSD